MPSYSYPDSIPQVADDWSPSEQRKGAAAAQSILDKGGSHADAMFACIAASGRSKHQREALFVAVTPHLIEVEQAVVRLAAADLELSEADANGIVQPTGIAPGFSPNVSREWSELEKRRLARVWDREMADTDAVGVLRAS